MLCSLQHDFAYGRPRVFAAGGYPCCCDTPGSSQVPSGGSSGELPQGSSKPALPGCEPCIDGWIAAHYLIELGGIAPGQTNCQACLSLNGAYVVEITGATESGCYGSLIIDGACQDPFGSVCYRQMLLAFGMPTPTQGVPVRVSIGPYNDDMGAGECSNVSSIVWQGYLSSPGQKLACLELNHAPLDFHNRTGAVMYCDPYESQAWITAL